MDAAGSGEDAWPARGGGRQRPEAPLSSDRVGWQPCATGRSSDCFTQMTASSPYRKCFGSDARRRSSRSTDAVSGTTERKAVVRAGCSEFRDVDVRCADNAASSRRFPVVGWAPFLGFTRPPHQQNFGTIPSARHIRRSDLLEYEPITVL